MKETSIDKYLFLDIDGVLNSQKFLSTTLGTPYPLDQFDPIAVERLNRIVEETGCKVVISSSWRDNYGLESVFEKVGLNFPIHGKTGYDVCRGKEIANWLKDKKKPYRYVILDDCDDHIDVYHSGHFIHTSETYGLREKHVKLAIKILNND